MLPLACWISAIAVAAIAQQPVRGLSVGEIVDPAVQREALVDRKRWANRLTDDAGIMDGIGIMPHHE